MKKRINILTLMLILFLIIIIIQDNRPSIDKHITEPYETAVIMNDSNNAEWDAIKLGMDQACHDFQVEMRVLYSGGDPNKQMDLLQREALAVDAIIISDVYDDNVADEIRELRNQLPIVVIGNRIMGYEDPATIASNDFEMGYDLALSVTSHNKPVLLISAMEKGEPTSYAAERHSGVITGLTYKGCEYKQNYINRDAAIARSQMTRIINSKEYGAIITLDVETLQMLNTDIGDVWSIVNNPPKLYGFGRTYGIIAGMESGITSVISVVNEYNLGYQSVETAVDLVNHKKTYFKIVPYRIVSGENIYNKENQALLFPIVQ